MAALTVGMAAGGDYLPMVGPPSLRFEAPRSAAARYPLPPLHEPAPTNATAHVTAATNAAPALAASQTHAAPAVPGPLPAEAPVVTALVPAWPAQPAQPAPFTTPDTPLSPQMFMHYFTRGAGTNGAAASVLIPMNFLPPLPLTAPSSSAVYEVTPGPKP